MCESTKYDLNYVVFGKVASKESSRFLSGSLLLLLRETLLNDFIEEIGVKVEPFRLLDLGSSTLVQALKELINLISEKSSVGALWQADAGVGQLHDLVSVEASRAAHVEQIELLSVGSDGIGLGLGELLLVFRTELI